MIFPVSLSTLIRVDSENDVYLSFSVRVDGFALRHLIFNAIRRRRPFANY